MEVCQLTINERIKTLLKEKNKKQTELAEYIGVSQNTVSDWINKGKNPSANHSYRISEFFEISIEYLYTGNSALIWNQIELTEDEKELLMNYHELDRLGQHKVHTAVYEEMNRINTENINTLKKKI